jgi:hypothetical protein
MAKIVCDYEGVAIKVVLPIFPYLQSEIFFWTTPKIKLYVDGKLESKCHYPDLTNISQFDKTKTCIFKIKDYHFRSGVKTIEVFFSITEKIMICVNGEYIGGAKLDALVEKFEYNFQGVSIKIMNSLVDSRLYVDDKQLDRFDGISMPIKKRGFRLCSGRKEV